MDDLRLLHDDHALLSSQVVHVITLVQSLEQSPNSTTALRAELTRQIELLRQQLCEHFAFEEVHAFPRLADLAPHLTPQFEQLREQHGAVLAAFDELHASVVSKSEADWTAISALGYKLETAFSDHASYEADLFQRIPS